SRSTSPALEHAAPQRGRHHLADDDDAEDRDEDGGDRLPVEQVDGALEYQSDAAGAYQAKHRRLADVDVPAQDRHGEESWQYLRNDPVQHDLRPAGPRRLDRLDLPLVYLLYGFRHQLADEADRPEGDGEDARHDAGAEYRDEEQGPDDRVHRARGDHDEAPDPQQDR